VINPPSRLFIIVIIIDDFFSKVLVILLSIAQKKHPKTIKLTPKVKKSLILKKLKPTDHENNKVIMIIIPIAFLKESFSLKTSIANKTVKTTSKLRNNDAWKADELANPINTKIGPKILPKMIIALILRISFESRYLSFLTHFRPGNKNRPENAYDQPDNTIGSISDNKILLIGVESPNNNAAIQARM
jgi:hypothetical protein